MDSHGESVTPAGGRADLVRAAGSFLPSERVVIGGASLLSFLAIWELAFRFAWVNPIFISSPIEVARASVDILSSPEFRKDLVVSGSEFLIGYSLAAAIGVPLGLAIGWYRRLSYALGPFIHTLNTIPRVTLLPLIIIWFGIGIWSKIMVVFLGAVIPMIISTYAGVHASEERFYRVARSFGASKGRLFRTVVLPGTVPFIFTGLKYASGRALLGVIVGELYAATAGIGYFIGATANALQTDKMLVGILIFVAAGLGTMEVLNRIERHFERWRPGVGAAERAP